MIPKDVGRQLEVTLTHLPACFSRLEFLASVRDARTGRYLHEGWVTLASRDEVHEMLQQAHRETFGLALRMPLVEFCSDLRASFADAERQSVALWLELETYRDMVPAGVSRASREFFLSQIKTALRILLAAPGWSAIRERAASPQQPLVLQPRHHPGN